MQNVVDIYPNFTVSARWALLAVLTVFLILALRLFGARLSRIFAMRTQARMATLSKVGKDDRINDALERLERLKQAYQSGRSDAAQTAEQVSVLVRETFDYVMNHRTRYQARYEVAARKLTRLDDVMSLSYPSEFGSSDDPVSLDMAVFDIAKEVLESCR